MDKNLKALFEACGSPETPNDVKEEAYDSYNDETFGSSMEPWEQSDSFESSKSRAGSNGTETESLDSSLALTTENNVSERSAEVVSPSCSKRVDEKDLQDKDNMFSIVDSTLSQLGLGLSRSNQATEIGELKNGFKSSQQLGESVEALDVDVVEQWPPTKPKSEEGYRGVKGLQKAESDVEDCVDRRESLQQPSLEARADPDRVIIGASGMVSPRRGSGRFDGSRYEREKAGYFYRRFSGQNCSASGGSVGAGGATGGATAGAAGGSPIRSENFDLRNVETFGVDAVQQHIQDHNSVPANEATSPNNNNNNSNNNASNNNAGSSSPVTHYVNGNNVTHSTHSTSTPRAIRTNLRYDEERSPGYLGGMMQTNERNAGVREKLPEIRDPRMYDFYVELWQRMQQQEDEENAKANQGNNSMHSLFNSSSSSSSNNNNSLINNNHVTAGGDGPMNQYPNVNFHNDSRSTCLGNQRRVNEIRMPEYSLDGSIAELKHKVWEQLELVAELGPFISVMEDINDRLIDPIDAPTPDERLKLLKKLSDNVNTDNVCNLVRLLHSRRLVMHSLAHLWSEPLTRDHSLELTSFMLRRLDTLLVCDGSDMVFGQKRDVFTRIFAGCNMEQLTELASSLLKSPGMAIESKLGLFFMGRMLDCVDNADVSSMPASWTNKLLPKITQHVARIQRADLIQDLVGTRALNHIIKNMDSVGIMRAVREATSEGGNTASY